ncbi:holin [Bacillus phage vB_BmeM-Goe8]|uniref:SPP1 like phage holin n=1 Tax=Bacillus phage vB_BmeM-Goe8 TaxID=2593638 RepID=A0A516KMT7_9CAUD|nr:holin [Bacillus phage vB_BmeM-Goe8]QDP42911.1 SPP1 like phage holin [Bacillus phage vB_BmeM-Goe8]
MGKMDNQNKPIRTVVQSVEVPVEAPKMSAKLVAITIFYLIVIVNAVAVMFGVDFKINPDYDKIYEGVTALSTVIAIITAAYKNHNYTKEARIKAVAAKQVDTEIK